MILVDTSAVLANLDVDEPRHDEVKRVIDSERDLIMPPFVLCELDYHVSQRFGVNGELELLDDVANGAYELASFDAADVAQALGVVQRYAELNIGLADASIVVLAERYETNRVLTLDARHFRALRVKGKKFVVLPADA